MRFLAINENVSVGENLRVGRGVVLSSPHGLRIGRGVAIGPRTTIQVDGSIGNFTVIGMNVQIAGRHDHAIDEIGTPILESVWVGDRPARPEDAVSIGVDVWIGGHATVLSGVTIGDGAIIGAAAVVTNNIPPFAIAVGCPARVVAYRFGSDAQRAEHLALLSRR
ncbi:MAG: acetyltransferase [Mycobacteriales bacterium]|nr:acetyltransferase [Mycobacteriales bacterium]